MPKPIIKRNAVDYQPVEFEEFKPTRPKHVIPADAVQIEGAPEKSNRKAVEIIASKQVRASSQNVEICVDDFSDTPFIQAPTDGLDSLAPMEDADADSSVDAEQLAELRLEWEEEWRAKLELALKSASEDAHQQGYQAAKEELEEDLAKQKEVFSNTLLRFHETWENFIKRNEPLLLEIALEITQFIVDAPLPGRFSRITESTLSEALEGLSRDTPITLSLNPIDLMSMQETGVMQLIKDQFLTLRLDPQPALSEGNWIIQTPRQAIRKVSEELLMNLKGQFGLYEQAYTELETHVTQSGYDEAYIPPVTNVAVSTTRPAPITDQSESLQTLDFSPATSTADKKSLDYQSLPDALSADE